jgi:hypothetical protein
MTPFTYDQSAGRVVFGAGSLGGDGEQCLGRRAEQSDYRTYGPIAERCARRLLVTQQSDPFSGEALVTSVTRRLSPATTV